MNKVHFKMFKAGKKWMVAGIVTMAMGTGAFFVTSPNANADVVANASSYLGTPYQYGGNSRSGIDCSALVQDAYAADGINLPRTSGAQYSATTPISASEAQSGDLVFFGNNGSDHVGIYSGNGNMINAETIDGVTYRPVSAMESVLGSALYGRVNGVAQAQAPVNNSAADTSGADTADQVNNDPQPTEPQSDVATSTPQTKILASTTPAGNESETTQLAGTTNFAATNAAPTDNGTQVTAEKDSDPQPTPAVNPVKDSMPTDQTNLNAASTPNDYTQTSMTKENEANQSKDSSVAENNNQSVSNASSAISNTDSTASNQVKNDNIVNLSRPVTTVSQNNESSQNKVATNQKNTLPATGEGHNSFLSIIGLVLISFVAFFGIKLRKNI